MPRDADLPSGNRPLRVLSGRTAQALPPKGVRFLGNARALESFLSALERQPPDWRRLYGAGGEGHRERLLAENRRRDRARRNRPALWRTIAFLWTGVLSEYRDDYGGFTVALGPELIRTRWGTVRFKVEQFPADLVAVPDSELLPSLRGRVSAGDRVQIGILLTGRLVPEEALIYDFAHDGSGEGMIMPVVRLERVDYFLKP